MTPVVYGEIERNVNLMAAIISKELSELADLLRPIQAETRQALQSQYDVIANPVGDLITHESVASYVITVYLDFLAHITPNIKKGGNLIGMDISEGKSPVHSARFFSDEVKKMITQRDYVMRTNFSNDFDELRKKLDQVYVRLLTQISEFLDRLINIIDNPDSAVDENGGYCFNLSLVLDVGETAPNLKQALLFPGMVSHPVASGSVPTVSGTPTAWEYTMLYTSRDGYFTNAISGVNARFELQLAALGSVGWELVTVTPIAVGMGETAATMWVFKRPVAW